MTMRDRFLKVRRLLERFPLSLIQLVLALT